MTLYRSLYAFSGNTSQHQLSFPAGATLHIDDSNSSNTSSGWLWGSYSGESGYIPSTYVTQVAESRNPPNTVVDDVVDFDTPMGGDYNHGAVYTFGSGSNAIRGFGGSNITTITSKPRGNTVQTIDPEYHFVKGVMTLPAGHTFVQKQPTKTTNKKQTDTVSVVVSDRTSEQVVDENKTGVKLSSIIKPKNNSKIGTRLQGLTRGFKGRRVGSSGN